MTRYEELKKRQDNLLKEEKHELFELEQYLNDIIVDEDKLTREISAQLKHLKSVYGVARV